MSGDSSEWQHDGLRVAASDIAGRGLFTDAPISAGSAVLRAADQLNHSCDPNLWWEGTTLVARRDIAPGEELTYDYSTASDDPGLRMFCHCETYRCRQLVAGDDWQIPQLQTRYAGHWHPAIAARLAH